MGEEEDRGVYVHAIILMSFAVIPVLINFVPKWIVMCCCKNVNDMRHRYVRKKYPEELLSIQVIGLNRDVSTLEDELESHQTENTVISAEFKHRLANLNSQLIVAQTALAKSVPSVERFLRALRLGQYVLDMQSNGLTVKKLIEIRGDVGRCIDPVMSIKPGHLRKLQRGLYNIARVMNFNFKYEERDEEKEERKRIERELKKKKLANKTGTVIQDVRVEEDDGKQEYWTEDGYFNENDEYVEHEYIGDEVVENEVVEDAVVEDAVIEDGVGKEKEEVV